MMSRISLDSLPFDLRTRLMSPATDFTVDVGGIFISSSPLTASDGLPRAFFRFAMVDPLGLWPSCGPLQSSIERPPTMVGAITFLLIPGRTAEEERGVLRLANRPATFGRLPFRVDAEVRAEQRPPQLHRDLQVCRRRRAVDAVHRVARVGFDLRLGLVPGRQIRSHRTLVVGQAEPTQLA